MLDVLRIVVKIYFGNVRFPCSPLKRSEKDSAAVFYSDRISVNSVGIFLVSADKHSYEFIQYEFCRVHFKRNSGYFMNPFIDT
jgi:hypothetical protein